MRNLILVLICVSMVSLISADGLQININETTVNKTFGQNLELQFTITNTETFSFFNITFNTNDVIQISKISELGPGEVATATGIITTNVDFDDVVVLKGFYNAQLGQNFETYDLSVDLENGVDECSKSIIKGDTIIWHNDIETTSGVIKLINSQTNNEIAFINPNGIYSEQFNEPVNLFYHFERFGLRFSDFCSLYVLDDNGLINNPEYDDNINLKVNVDFAPTTILVTILERNYKMDFFSFEEGLMSVTNTGINPAKNIKLGGDWFTSFSKKNFDLNPGQTNTISYRISPSITATEQTDKNYTKFLNITGNFDTASELFNIFINPAIIDLNNSFQSSDWIRQGLAYCDSRSSVDDNFVVVQGNLVICPEETQIVYRNINGSEIPVNITLTEEQLKQQRLFEFLQADLQDEFRKESLKFYNEFLGLLNETKDSSQLSADSSFITQENLEDIVSGLYSFIVFLVMIFIIVILIIGVWWIKQKRNTEYASR